jgi:hypothetical protein
MVLHQGFLQCHPVKRSSTLSSSSTKNLHDWHANTLYVCVLFGVQDAVQQGERTPLPQAQAGAHDDPGAAD